MAAATAAVTAKAAEDVAQKENEQEVADVQTGDGNQEATLVEGETAKQLNKVDKKGEGSTWGDKVPPHSHDEKSLVMGGVGGDRAGMPFKMKASDHGNSPIQKNFGSKEKRGFPMSNFGVNSTEKQGGVGSEMEPPL